MNYSVKIGDRTFIVQISDLRTRPVVAIVDGEAIEVWPEEAVGPVPVTAPSPATAARTDAPVHLPVPHRKGSNGKTASQIMTAAELARTENKGVRAPIPGVIVSLSVRAGDSISAGQEVCILEAMKMKNVIHSKRDGVIARVLVTPGQTVRHHDMLMEFEE